MIEPVKVTAPMKMPMEMDRLKVDWDDSPSLPRQYTAETLLANSVLQKVEQHEDVGQAAE